MRKIVLHALEYVEGTLAQVLDSTPETTTRTIQMRLSNTPFTQTGVGPEWVTLARNSDITGVVGKYVQYRIFFALGAAMS